MALNQYIRLQTWRIRLPSFAQSNSIPSTNVIQVCGPDERGEICLRLPTQIVIRPHSFVISVDNIIKCSHERRVAENTGRLNYPNNNYTEGLFAWMLSSTYSSFRSPRLLSMRKFYQRQK